MYKFNKLIIQFTPNGRDVLIKGTDGRYVSGTLLDSPRSAGFNLYKKSYNLYSEPRSMIDYDSIARYYNIENTVYNNNSLVPLGGRFILYKDGTCELTRYGSGLPIISTEYGKLLKIK